MIIDNIYDVIAKNPSIGIQKSGDLQLLFTVKFKYAGVQYRIAYDINELNKTVLIILVGKRENFYQILHRLLFH